MKNKLISCVLALVFILTALCSCGEKDTFENFFVAVKGFDMSSAAECVSESSSDYMDSIIGYTELLSEEQRETAAILFSYIGYSYKEQSEAKDHVDITLTYVDFDALIRVVEENIAVGSGSASDYINDILNGENFSGRYTEKTDISVAISDDGKVYIGHTSANKELTGYLGLDTFLRWYANQR